MLQYIVSYPHPEWTLSPPRVDFEEWRKWRKYEKIVLIPTQSGSVNVWCLCFCRLLYCFHLPLSYYWSQCWSLLENPSILLNEIFVLSHNTVLLSVFMKYSIKKKLWKHLTVGEGLGKQFWRLKIKLRTLPTLCILPTSFLFWLVSHL